MWIVRCNACYQVWTDPIGWCLHFHHEWPCRCTAPLSQVWRTQSWSGGSASWTWMPGRSDCVLGSPHRPSGQWFEGWEGRIRSRSRSGSFSARTGLGPCCTAWPWEELQIKQGGGDVSMLAPKGKCCFYFPVNIWMFFFYSIGMCLCNRQQSQSELLSLLSFGTAEFAFKASRGLILKIWTTKNSLASILSLYSMTQAHSPPI